MLKVVTETLEISEKAKSELVKIDGFDFNIFSLRELTEGRELEAAVIFILAKRECFVKTTIDINRMINFVRAIQNGYKRITYHNKTHGADLCQTLNSFLIDGQLG
jgi:hypothetical protein